MAAVAARSGMWTFQNAGQEEKEASSCLQKGAAGKKREHLGGLQIPMDRGCSV